MTSPSFVRVTIHHPNGEIVYDGYHRSVTAGNAALVVDVPGVGDRAFEAPSGASQTSIYFVKGQTEVSIDLAVPAGAPPKDKAVALATAAAGRV